MFPQYILKPQVYLAFTCIERLEPNTFRAEPFNIFFKSGQIVRFGYQHLNAGTAQPFTQRP